MHQAKAAKRAAILKDAFLSPCQIDLKKGNEIEISHCGRKQSKLVPMPKSVAHSMDASSQSFVEWDSFIPLRSA